MQVNYFNNFGGVIRDIKLKGNTLTGDLILIRDPVDLNEAATKNYVDNLFNSLNVMLITTGVLSPTQLPALSGDVVSNPGTNVTSLLFRGFTVTPVTKTAVNQKGIVEAIFTLSGSDIPGFDWSKITADKPTTLGGYGITDAIDTSGGSVDVNLTMAQNPTSAKEVATKAYVDAAAASVNSAAVTGDLIYKPTDITPLGYLRCNGALLVITAYQALFDKIGHVGSNPGGGYFYLPNLSDLSNHNYNYFIKY